MKSNKRRPTLIDVAKLAGVSTSSASMILNNKKGVSFQEDTKENVFKAAEQLGYKVKTQKDRQTLLEGGRLIIISANFNKLLSLSVAHYICKLASKDNYQVLIFNNCANKEKEEELLEIIREHRVMGVIYSAYPLNIEVAKAINEQIPTVILNNFDYEDSFDSIDTNDQIAASTIVKSLVEKGHKNIAYVYTTYKYPSLTRLKAIKGAKKEADLHEHVKLSFYKKDVELESDLDPYIIEYQTGYHLALSILKKEPNIDSFIGSSDFLACGIVDACKELDYINERKIPVASFGNSFLAYLKSYSLTSVDYSIDKLAMSAYNLLTTKIREPLINKGVIRIKYNPQLIEKNKYFD